MRLYCRNRFLWKISPDFLPKLCIFCILNLFDSHAAPGQNCNEAALTPALSGPMLANACTRSVSFRPRTV